MAEKQLRNLGPASWKMLNKAGIEDVATIKKMGAAACFLHVNATSDGVSLNLLYAIAAGLEDRDWRSLDADEKARLSRETADLKDMMSPAELQKFMN